MMMMRMVSSVHMDSSLCHALALRHTVACSSAGAMQRLYEGSTALLSRRKGRLDLADAGILCLFEVCLRLGNACR